MTEHVVFPALFGIAQDVVRPLHLFETSFGDLATIVEIRVMLPGQPAVRFLYLIVCG
jgi:hypothetical protein